MDDSRAVELAVAVRMTLSRLVVTRKRREELVFVTVADSRTYLDISNIPGLLEKEANLVGQRPVLRVPHNIEGAELAEKLTETVRKSGKLPIVISVKNEALLVVGTRRGETVDILDGLLGKRVTTAKLRPRNRGRLVGHVAIVTGGAQGFGEGIAEFLSGEGACVVVADINDQLGESVVARITQMCGRGSALFQHTDVTDARSTRACVIRCVRSFGGVDLFVANAGVLRACGLAEMDEKTFDLVTSVNYKAFFLGVKSVAQVMQIQHTYNPTHFMDIIQINSKSGLQGSNRNFAYSGSKFGSIGLVQSFALELIPDRIKVNAVCPGNYFDGPLWSDPEHGLFVQYLHAGKVPGARSVEDVRRFYLSKVPMGRGCLPSDVAKAILYLHDQEYETGQALPVTGGQIMLK